MTKCICGHDRSHHKSGFPVLAKCEYQKQVHGSGFFCDCGEYRVDEDSLPSGDALDRAEKLVQRATGQPGRRQELVNEIAKLIDRAGAVADKALISGHTVVHWHNAAERRIGQINDLEKVVRQRNYRIAELENELEELRRNGGANLLNLLERTKAVEKKLERCQQENATLRTRALEDITSGELVAEIDRRLGD